MRSDSDWSRDLIHDCANSPTPPWKRKIRLLYSIFSIQLIRLHHKKKQGISTKLRHVTSPESRVTVVKVGSGTLERANYIPTLYLGPCTRRVNARKSYRYLPTGGNAPSRATSSKKSNAESRSRTHENSTCTFILSSLDTTLRAPRPHRSDRDPLRRLPYRTHKRAAGQMCGRGFD